MIGLYVTMMAIMLILLVACLILWLANKDLRSELQCQDRMLTKEREFALTSAKEAYDRGVASQAARTWQFFTAIQTDKGVKTYFNGKPIKGTAVNGASGVGFWFLDGHIRGGFAANGEFDDAFVERLYAKEAAKIMTAFQSNSPMPD